MAKDELLAKLADLSEAPADRAMRSQKAILMAKILEGKPYILRKESAFADPKYITKLKVTPALRAQRASMAKLFSEPANVVKPKLSKV